MRKANEAQLDLLAWVRPEPAKVEAEPVVTWAKHEVPRHAKGTRARPRKVAPGDVFGLLTVVRQALKSAGDKRKGKLWLCLCECGAELVLHGPTLVGSADRGCTSACAACRSKVHGDRVRIDMAGQRFGRLTALSVASKPEGRPGGSVWWLFRCDCGAEVVRQRCSVIMSVKQGRSPSCIACGGLSRRTPRPEIVIKPDAYEVMGEFTVYCHTHVDSGKRYVGITKNGLDARWRGHVSAAKKPDTAFGAAIHKYGAAAFVGEVLEIVGNWGAAMESEQRWISHHKSDKKEFGYNRTSGGECYVASEETIRKHKESWARWWESLTPEARADRLAKQGRRSQRTWADMSQEKRDAHLAKMLASKREKIAAGTYGR